MEKKRFFGFTLLLGLLFVFLTGCAGKETTSEYALTRNDVETTVTYIASGDKVQEQTTVNKIPYEALGVTTKGEAQSLFDEPSKAVQGIKGYSDTVEYSDTYAIDNVKIDYSIFDLDKASQISGMALNSSAKKNGVSLKKSEELVLSKGFKKTK